MTTPTYGAPPAVPAGPAPKQGNGFAVTALILAILVCTAPLGLIFGIIGLVRAKSVGGKGKGMSIVAIILSLLVMVGGGVGFVLVGDKVLQIANPGCTEAINVINNADVDGITNPTTLKTKIEGIVDGLEAAAAKSTNDDATKAIETLIDDYQELADALSTGDLDPDFIAKVTADEEALNKACGRT